MAQEILIKNNAVSTLLAGITAAATSLSVQATHGARFSAPVAGQIAKVTLYNDALDREVIHLITRSGDGFTVIVRGQEGTTPRAWNAGDAVEQTATADFLKLLSQLDRTETYTAPKSFSGGIPNITGGIGDISGGIGGVVPFSGGIGPSYIQNIGLAVSVAAKALTVALKTKALVDPTALLPVEIAFRNRTETTGDYVVRQIVAAASIVVPNGATLGYAAAEAGLIYVYACDNGTIREIGLSRLHTLDESGLHATTAISAAADAAGVLYTTTAMTDAAIRLIGKINIATGAVAGEWDNEDTKVTLWTPAMSRPSFVIDSAVGSSASSVGCTATFSPAVNVEVGDIVRITYMAECVRNGADYHMNFNPKLRTGTAVLADTGMTNNNGMPLSMTGVSAQGASRNEQVWSADIPVATAGTIIAFGVDIITTIGTDPISQQSYIHVQIIRPNN